MALLSYSKKTKLIGSRAERGKRQSEGEKEENDKVSWDSRNTEVKDTMLEGFV
jgi:hypothetical protein